MYANPSKAISFIDTSAQTLAKAYALRPTVLKNYSLENFSIAGFEINFTEILKLASRTSPYKKLARFPSIKIDVSVLIDSKVEVKTIEEVIKNSDKNLIKETNLFDIYEGKNIEDDKKAVAFSITLQAEDRTLTDQEMTDIQKKIFSNLEKLGGVIRGK
ncbi:hypothetical protein HZC20_02270 [Candidatus Peregrinibacteria bacterium]|nr:hypothetical protein [Candidatus Peregrinibacteria bacterium]